MQVPIPLGEAVSVIKEGVETYGKSFVSQTFQRPDGSTYDFLFFKYRSVPTIIMAVANDGCLIVEHQFREAANQVITEVPGGNIKPGQSLEDAVIQELVEETGFRPSRVIRLQEEQIWFEPASFGVAYIPVLALGCKKTGDPKPDPNEFIKVEVITLEQWFKLIRQGRVNDSKSLALTTLLAMYFDLIDLSRSTL